jgi:predicted Fe-Mo cluster-binding NifX family protein
MVLFDKVRQNAEALRQVGERALADARKAGVPVYYMDDAFGDAIIREFPDGHRERIARGEQGAITPIGTRR